jgi:predicted permease
MSRWRHAILRLLPPTIRDRFSREWLDTVNDLATDAEQRGGRRARWLYIAREAVDAVRVSAHLRHTNVATGGVMSAVLIDDVRWALRHARRRPAFAASVSLTLAASIAVATTAFGLATAVLWRPLPFAGAHQLAFVWEEIDRDGDHQPSRVTSSRFAAWRDTSSGLASIALFGGTGFTVDRGGTAATVHGVRVSANYFDTLGVSPMLGRGFTAADEVQGNHRVVVLSSAFWRDHLGARATAIGEVLRLNDQPYTIVGVMPALTVPAWPVNPAIVTLEPDQRSLWVPIARTPALDRNGGAHVFGAIARLAPGVTNADVIERLNRTSASGVDRHRARLVPLREQFVSDARTPLLALSGAALALLLIACTNLAALYVSAFEARRAELAMRAALGAGVIRISRQLAVEAMVLAAAGAAGGMALARVALAAVPGLLPPTIPFLTTPVLDLRVAGFAAGLAAVATLLLTGWPIVRLLSAPPTPRGATTGPSQLVYRVLVIAEIAVTVALVAAAGLLGQSLRTVQRRDPGFSLDRIFVADIGLPGMARNTPQSVAQSEDALIAAIAHRPDVEAVTASYDHPLEANWSETPTLVGDGTTPDQQRQFELRIVRPGYFDALDITLLDGRAFTERDTAGAPGVAMVNAAFARVMDGNVLGRRLRTGTPQFAFGNSVPNEFEIVGIVDNERFRGLEQPVQPAFYLSTRQFPQTGFSLIVRTAGDPIAITPDVRAAIRETDPRITFDHATSLDAILADQMASRRVTTDVIGGFAAVALALAALGIYGLIAIVVGGRTREIGLRLAIGASPASVVRHVLVSSLGNAAIGVSLGVVLAIGTGKFVRSLLVDVSGSDPMTLSAVAATLVAVSFIAALLPARRAGRVDPAVTLRAE